MTISYRIKNAPRDHELVTKLIFDAPNDYPATFEGVDTGKRYCRYPDEVEEVEPTYNQAHIVELVCILDNPSQANYKLVVDGVAAGGMVILHDVGDGQHGAAFGRILEFES